MVEWKIVKSNERNEFDLFINGEWYAQGTYEQMQEMKDNYLLYIPDEDEEYCADDYDEPAEYEVG